MAVLVPKEMKKNRLLAYLAIIIIMIGGIVFFIFKILSSAPANVKQEPASVLNESIEIEPVAPEQDGEIIKKEAGEEKKEEDLSAKIFTNPQFKALKDNSVD